MFLDNPKRTTHSNANQYIASTEKSQFELAQLPSLLSRSPWTVYTDDVPHLDTKSQSCTEKWLGTLEPETVSILNVRPDGYVGSVGRFQNSSSPEEAAAWLESYYGGFLAA